MSLDPNSFALIAKELKARSGLAIGPDKTYLLESRLAPLLQRHGMRDLAALADCLRRPAHEAVAEAMAEAMTTHESFFFRDGKPFEHFTNTMLPRLTAARPAGTKLRIWSAAASSGQEAYSLAMLGVEHSHRLRDHKLEILGTDIAHDVLEQARAGFYTAFEVQRGLPPALLKKYFQPSDGGFRLNDTIRAMVRFREWNLLNDPAPLGQFDVIFCRNVLIYFDQPTKSRVLDAMAKRLAPDGVVYLGGAETATGLTELLVPAPDHRGAYMRAAKPPSAPDAMQAKALV